MRIDVLFLCTFFVVVGFVLAWSIKPRIVTYVLKPTEITDSYMQFGLPHEVRQIESFSIFTRRDNHAVQVMGVSAQYLYENDDSPVSYTVLDNRTPPTPPQSDTAPK